MAGCILSFFNLTEGIDFVIILTSSDVVLIISNFQKPQSSSFFNNKSIVFTGSLLKLSRDEAKHLARELGATITSTVSKRTDYVIVGDKPGSKAKKAMELKIPIMTEDDWLNKIKP